jgi:isorenieratene synthase
MSTPDYDSINLIAQYSKIHKEYIDWANETGGSVIEFHCYTWDKHFNLNVSDEMAWILISPIVKQILPEIFDKNFKILARTVNSLQDFSSFESGLAKYRPYTDSLNKLKNVYLAGDWIRTNYVSQLMEKAVSTGREAVNHILLKDHVRQAPIRVTTPYGPGLF